MNPGLLIFGADGQLGRELQTLAPNHGFAAVPLDSREGDVTDRGAVLRALRARADVVINAGAYTAVDRAESEPDRAFAVNRDGPSHLAEACAAAGRPLIHLSTDYVYDGRKTAGWKETDPVNPLGVYGASKLAGEQAVRERHDRHLIIRTSWVYAAHGRNFVRTMLRLGGEGEELRVVDDQKGCPTAAVDLARACLTVAQRVLSGHPLWGTYHYCGRGETTWYGFAKQIFLTAEKHGRKRPRLIPVPTAEYPTPARRPANSVLDCTKIEKNFGVSRPAWQDSLATVVAQLCKAAA